jgi:hypothetical protein
MLRCAGALLLVTACAAPAPWKTLCDGRSLDGWTSTPFGGEGEVRLEDGAAILDFGNPLTGITWTGAPPDGEYEIAVRAARLAGSDFFCGLTFPAGDEYCTLVLGGWGGALTGLSSIDGRDAAHNETRSQRRFADGRRYEVLVRVERARIRAWLDGEILVDQAIAGRRLSVRPEVELSKPLGIAAYNTRAAIESVAWRRL